ncbi:amidohydrolase family protein [Kitasatospora sp. NPDC087271]|uniref:amidohydrolase family protein n=1 Tax=Kitasatospora sp. NPDC087271 TaxID=3364067 RepID=UPI00381FFE87
MRLIAVEEHFLPSEHGKEVMAGYGLPPAAAGPLADLGAGRIAVMDAAGIDVQVLSVVAPAAQEVPRPRAVDLARALNDRAAEAIRQYPGRFRALASLPMPVPEAAAVEAFRAVRDLGFCGVIINGHTGGRFLDSAEFEPVLAAAEELGVPVYLHPTYPPAAVIKAYGAGLDPAVAALLVTAGWGWHAETGMHVLRMVLGGVFDRHPRLQVIVGHMGENLPFSLLRADEVLSRLRPGHESVADTVRSHVHLTISGYTTVAPLQCALTVFGADRLMFSTDYPFGDPVQHATFLQTAPLSPEDRDKIAHTNAERLFNI